MRQAVSDLGCFLRLEKRSVKEKLSIAWPAGLRLFSEPTTMASGVVVASTSTAVNIILSIRKNQ